MSGLVLSLFPGIGLLDRAFEEAGWCVVRGPDLLWGGDVKEFHPPPGRFDGVIGGPPCKCWSPLVNVVRAVHGEASVAEDLIPEYVRVVREAAPIWFLMENVQRAPVPKVNGYIIRDELLNNRHVGGVQNRVRRFSFGTRDGRRLRIDHEVFEPVEYRHAVTASAGGRRAAAVIKNGKVYGKQGSADDARLARRRVEDMAADQGMPPTFITRLKAHGAFTDRALKTGIGNGVPLPMGRAIADAVTRAMR